MWSRIDDQLEGHPKVIAAEADSPGCLSLWIRVLSWCASHETDGRFPRILISRYCSDPQHALSWSLALIRAGLWDDPGGAELQVHDYLDYNPSAEERERERAGSVERVRRHRLRKQQAGQLALWGSTYPQGAVESAPAPIPIPIPSPIPADPPPSRAIPSPPAPAPTPQPPGCDVQALLADWLTASHTTSADSSLICELRDRCELAAKAVDPPLAPNEFARRALAAYAGWRDGIENRGRVPAFSLPKLLQHWERVERMVRGDDPVKPPKPPPLPSRYEAPPAPRHAPTAAESEAWQREQAAARERAATPEAAAAAKAALAKLREIA